MACAVHLLFTPSPFVEWALLLLLSDGKTETYRDQDIDSGHTAVCAAKERFVHVYIDSKNYLFPL